MRYQARQTAGRQEGLVALKSDILLDGTLKNTKIVRTLRHEILDSDALKVLQDVAPFPFPPNRFFKSEVQVPITMAFQLTVT